MVSGGFEGNSTEIGHIVEKQLMSLDIYAEKLMLQLNATYTAKDNLPKIDRLTSRQID
jgi:hypothetical protein